MANFKTEEIFQETMVLHPNLASKICLMKSNLAKEFSASMMLSTYTRRAVKVDASCLRNRV